MKRSLCMAAALAVLVAATQASAQNLLANPGFELPTSTDTSTGNWFRFGSGAGGVSADSTTMPRSGSGHVSLTTVGANQFAGVFQLLPVPVSPGQIVTFTGWHKTTTPPFDGTVELKIEWTGAPQNRVDHLALGTDYEMFTHTGVAPAGTTGATITYAISSFGPGQDGTVNVFIDDFSATLIPEPATLGMAAVGLLALCRIRRRK